MQQKHALLDTITFSTLLKLGLFPLRLLVDKRFVNMRNDSTTSNRSFDECIQFFISADCQLKMPRCDTLDFQIFTCISGELKDLGCEIF